MLLSRAYTRCPAILVYCSVRYWTWFCYLIGIAVHTLSDSLRIFFFHSGDRIKKKSEIHCQILWIDGSRIRKE